MNRKEKAQIIDAIKHDFQSSQASFVITVKGMTVGAVQKLRSELYAKKGKIKVTKNTLLKRATSDLSGINDLAPYFKDQIAVVFAGQEGPAIAKILYAISKEHEALKFKAGSLDARLITAEQIVYLATLPPKEQLLAQLLGTLQAPMSNFVSILYQLLARLVWVLKEIEKKKQ